MVVAQALDPGRRLPHVALLSSHHLRNSAETDRVRCREDEGE